MSKVSPNHYQFGKAQVIDITQHLGFCEGNVVKYCCRAGRKDGETRLDDLLKAKKYLDTAIRQAVDEKAREILANDQAAADSQAEACQAAGAPLKPCSSCPASGSCMVERLAQEASEAVSSTSEGDSPYECDDQIQLHTSVPEFIDKIGTRAGVKKRIL